MASKLGYLIAVAACLGGCGVADSGSAVATVAAAKQQERENARAAQQRIQRELEAGMQARQQQLGRMEQAGR